MKTSRFFHVLLLLVTAVAAAAQVSFKVLPPGNIVVGDKFPLTFRLENAEGTNFNIGQIPGCQKLYGPTTYNGMSYVNNNGHVTRSSKQEYTVYYQATTPGKYTIPSASIMVNGKRYTTRPLQFTVHASAVPQPAPASSRPTSIDDVDTQNVERPVNPSDVFVRIILSRTKVY